MPEVTLQTLITNSSDNQTTLFYLKEYSEIFGSAIRTGFTIRNNMGVVKTSSKQLKTDIAKVIEARLGLSNSEARNAATVGLANYDSHA